MKRNYIDGPDGQIHIYEWGDDTTQAPLICLSPAPFSGKAYLTLAPLLADKRKVVAIDYPGYGNSDAGAKTPMITDYAKAVSAVIASITNASSSQQADLVGFHSGSLVAVEVSLNHAHQVRNLILIDVPFFSPEKQAELLTKASKPIEINGELQMFDAPWRLCVTSKLEHVPIARAYDIFVDHIATGQATNAAFNAAFNYPCEQRFKQVSHPCHVIATKAGMYEVSCAAAGVIPNASLTEQAEITTAVLENGAPIIANTIDQLLT